MNKQNKLFIVNLLMVISLWMVPMFVGIFSIEDPSIYGLSVVIMLVGILLYTKLTEILDFLKENKNADS